MPGTALTGLRVQASGPVPAPVEQFSGEVFHVSECGRGASTISINGLPDRKAALEAQLAQSR